MILRHVFIRDLVCSKQYYIILSHYVSKVKFHIGSENIRSEVAKLRKKSLIVAIKQN